MKMACRHTRHRHISLLHLRSRHRSRPHTGRAGAITIPSAPLLTIQHLHHRLRHRMAHLLSRMVLRNSVHHSTTLCRHVEATGQAHHLPLLVLSILRLRRLLCINNCPPTRHSTNHSLLSILIMYTTTRHMDRISHYTTMDKHSNRSKHMVK
jgi:hypothetical protein